jgi:predicted transposase YdaD
MERLYDITKDYLYQEGLLKGEERGIEKGAENTRREIIVEMLRDGALAHHKIAALAKVPIEYVTQISQELKA